MEDIKVHHCANLQKQKSKHLCSLNPGIQVGKEIIIPSHPDETMVNFTYTCFMVGMVTGFFWVSLGRAFTCVKHSSAIATGLRIFS